MDSFSVSLLPNGQIEDTKGSASSNMLEDGGHDKKGAWTLLEDHLLLHQIQAIGIDNWSQIAKGIEGRNGKSCRLRWHNQLNPDLNHDPYTSEEDRLIISAHRNIGNRWSTIAKLLQGRTDNSVKNRWNSTLARKAQSAKTLGIRNGKLGKMGRGSSMHRNCTKTSRSGCYTEELADRALAKLKSSEYALPCKQESKGFSKGITSLLPRALERQGRPETEKQRTLDNFCRKTQADSGYSAVTSPHYGPSSSRFPQDPRLDIRTQTRKPIYPLSNGHLGGGMSLTPDERMDMLLEQTEPHQPNSILAADRSWESFHADLDYAYKNAYGPESHRPHNESSGSLSSHPDPSQRYLPFSTNSSLGSPSEISREGPSSIRAHAALHTPMYGYFKAGYYPMSLSPCQPVTKDSKLRLIRDAQRTSSRQAVPCSQCCSSAALSECKRRQASERRNPEDLTTPTQSKGAIDALYPENLSRGPHHQISQAVEGLGNKLSFRSPSVGRRHAGHFCNSMYKDAQDGAFISAYPDCLDTALSHLSDQNLGNPENVLLENGSTDAAHGGQLIQDRPYGSSGDLTMQSAGQVGEKHDLELEQLVTDLFGSEPALTFDNCIDSLAEKGSCFYR